MNYQTLYKYGLLVILVSPYTSAITPQQNPSTEHSIINQLTPRSSPNNFLDSDPISGGELYCYGIGYLENCYAFLNNTTDTYLNLRFDDNSIFQVEPGQVIAVKSTGKNPCEMHVEVTNTNSEETVYDYFVQDMRGLTCNSETCEDWN